MNRRDFLKTITAAAAGTVAGTARLSYGAGGHANAGRPRPPGTCGGWTDADGNGRCDHSEHGAKLCGKVRCPGNARNPLRSTAARAGAPQGTCALWSAPQKAGVCAVSSAAEKPCLYAACPAHKDHAGKNARVT